ncbi:hypothetical protein [Flindersiella endophytica]
MFLLAGSPVLASDLLHCPKADLAVSMTGSQQVRPGAAGSYRIVVENEGEASAWHTKVRVSVDPALIVTGVPDGCALTENKIKCKRKKIKSGESWNIELPFRAIDDAVLDSTAYTTATADSVSDDADESDNSTAIRTHIGKPLADLEITATRPPELAPGTSYDLRFKIVNRGPATAPKARVTGVVDGHLIVERMSDSCRLHGGNLACELGRLRAGESRELRARVRLGARRVGRTPLTSRFTVTGPASDDPDRSDNDVAVNGRIVPAQLSLRTGVSDTNPRPGAELTFTVEVGNADGAGTAADVVVADRLPAAVDLIAAEPSRGGVNPAGDGRLLWSVGDLAAGESASLALRVRVTTGAQDDTVLVNQAGVVRGPPATVTSACPGTPRESCSTTDPVPAAAAPAAEVPTPSTSPVPRQVTPQPRPSPTTGRPGHTPTPTTTPEPTTRIALVPHVHGSSPAGSGFGPLLVVSMSLTSVLVAIRLLLFLRRR